VKTCRTCNAEFEPQPARAVHCKACLDITRPRRVARRISSDKGHGERYADSVAADRESQSRANDLDNIIRRRENSLPWERP
jgi:hypothetical protein